VTVAPDEDPGSDPWTADPSVPTFDIADGDVDRLLVEGDFSEVPRWTPRSRRCDRPAAAG
jgi:hypothetical protein